MLDLCIIRTTYTDTFEGEPVDPDTDVTLHEDLDLHEAIELCRGQGVTFAATGTTWAADPDGSHVIDYATGKVEEVSVHPQGSWWPWEFAALQAGVDTDAGSSLSFGYLLNPQSNGDSVD